MRFIYGGESNYYVYNKWLFILDLGLENMNSIEWIIRYTLRQKKAGDHPLLFWRNVFPDREGYKLQILSGFELWDSNF